MTRQDDLARLATSYETGWYDHQGNPAPWPDDFFDDDSGWHVAGSEDPTGLEPF